MPSHGSPTRPHLGTRRKVVLSVATLAVSAAVTVTGTYAAFTASASRGHQVTTGVPLLTLGTTGTAANRLGVDATNLGPGDSVYRAFDVTNAGTITFTALTVSTEITTSSLLDTDPVNGLKGQLESCSNPWTESGTSPAFTYTCTGTRAPVLATRPVAMAGQPLPGLKSLRPGGTDHLLLTETLPLSADNRFINQLTALTYTFNAG